MLLEYYKKSEENMNHVVYGDTDSFFVDVSDLYYSKFDVSKDKVKQILLKDLNNVYDNECQEYEHRMKNLAEDVRREVINNVIDVLSSSCNCTRKNTIEFKLEYISTFFKSIAQKSYVYKKLKENKISKKNFGVKRSDPMFTRKNLDNLVKNLFIYGESDSFLFSFVSTVKNYIDLLQNLDITCGIPTSIQSDISSYKTFTAQLRGLVNYLALRYILKKSSIVELPLENNIEYKGFRYRVNPTKELISLESAIIALYNKLKEKNSLIEYKRNCLTELFIPDSIFIDSEMAEIYKQNIKKYFTVDIENMVDLSLVSYIERLTSYKIDMKLCKYLSNCSNIDLNIVKKYVR